MTIHLMKNEASDMKYDFTTILDRKGKDALALDMVGHLDTLPAPREGFDPIPMWVADMNFPVVPTVQEAIAARVREPHTSATSRRGRNISLRSFSGRGTA